MKILHIGKYYSPIEGGIESINKFVVESLQGSIQRILTFNNLNQSSENEVNGIPIVRAASKGVIASQPLSLKYFWEMKRYLDLFNPDIVHLHYPNPLAAFYLLLLNKRYKLIVHWHSDIVAQRFIHKVIKPIENKLLKRADLIIATSPNYFEASLNLQKHKNKVTIIPCSIDEDRFELLDDDYEKINEIKQQYNNKPIVFFIGRHVEYKGIRYLLEAESMVKEDCVFLIAGKGPLSDSLKTQFNSKRIHWLGRLTDDELKYYYYAATLFAFPSITRNEAFGVVLAEAMYCGCPALTFTIKGSGVNWVSINNFTGIESPNRDSKAFAMSIDKLLKDKDLLKLYGENAKGRVELLFNKKKVSELYRKAYNSLFATNR